jgi:hypothetical protein
MRRFTSGLVSTVAKVRAARAHAAPRLTIAIAIAAACACVLTSLVPQPARAQDTAAEGPAFEGLTAALPAAAPKPPTVPAVEVSKLSVDAQVQWLRRAAQSGMLERLDDATLVELFSSLDPHTLPRYIGAGPNGYSSYEFTMLREERIRGVWPSKPDHMLVRITHEPLRIYAKWLPDGAHAGQEIIYDAALRNDQMYGHLGGILNVMSVWTSLDGMLAHTQSNHDLRELGIESVAQEYVADSRKFDALGERRSATVEVKTLAGVRVVALTFEAPPDGPEFYAKKETLGLDLQHPYFRTVESYGDDGRIFERIVFEHITPKTLPDDTFDPKNPAYHF